MKFTYLLVDFFSIIVTFIFSFHPAIKFYKVWKAFFPAALITGIFFILWDELFTRLGVWGFNPKYLTGIYFMHLPLEELLFFLCIPYACVFTFYCIELFYKKAISKRIETAISLVLIVFLLTLGILNFSKLYTSVTFISLSFVVFIIKYGLKASWLGRFYFTYLFLLIPFIITNGILTGTGLEEPVVWYNNDQNLGIRILTIPFEDIFYGMELILLNVMLFQLFRKNS